MKKLFNKIMEHKVLATAVVATAITILGSGCASFERCQTDFESEINNGIEREINIYTHDGKLIAHHEGKMDIETDNDSYILFHINGKRYVYYYGIAIVEVIEK